jgi:signal transduction histidine kinase
MVQTHPDAEERQTMDQPLWPQLAPREGPQLDPLWTGEPPSLAALSRMRSGLRSAVHTAADDGRPAGLDDDAIDDALERLLLVFEELVSNGLRHGRPPIGVTVQWTGCGWLLSVADDNGKTAPVPAVGRDTATGGMGLYMAARLSSAHGWTRDGLRKTVWAVIEPVASAAPAVC